MNTRTITLLAFLAITVLTAVAVLAAAVGWLPKANPQLVSWGIPAVLGEIVVTVILYVKSPPAQAIKVNLAFQGVPASKVDLSDSGTYTILDMSGKERLSGTVVPILGPGGYQVTLPVALHPTDSVAMSFTEREGQSWAVRPFLPHVHTQAAVRSTEIGGLL